jgi:dienelactone hydrolase
VAADYFGGAPADLTAAAGQRHSGRYATSAGTLRTIELRGPLSKINRPGLVYLPPQYFERRYAHTRFPVVELLHGSPGKPSDWVLSLRLKQVADLLISRHLMGPVILVMPTVNVGRRYLECLNVPGEPDDTYVSEDVPRDVRALLRASTDPAELGIGGYSSGGYCAANLALRHRQDFGAAAIMDGYFRPQDGPARIDLGGKKAAMNANDPLRTAGLLPPDTTPMPAFWLAAGTGARSDFVAAQAFAAAMQHLEQVSFGAEPGAGHNFYAWAAALPSALTWFWQQLAPPDLRVQFPVSGKPGSLQLPPVLHGPRKPAPTGATVGGRPRTD